MVEPVLVDQLRYRRIVRFFAGAIAHFIWWDVTLVRVPGTRSRVVASRPRRLRHVAREFRALAVDMGGVMIKLGQFLSSRVDILPAELTEELQGLQDEVPAADSGEVFALMRSELGDLSQHFARIEPEPIAAASLGQVYRAWLKPEGGEGLGEQVVIKVQRPRIADMVRTDLAALRQVARWVMRYKPIRRRANMPALLEEFAYTLWQELDFESEADNAGRFAQIHADDPRIYIPNFYRQHSTRRVVVMEDVTSLKVADLPALQQAGVDPKAVADTLLDAYFTQIFVAEYFHADPHPGNIFVRPLPQEQVNGSGGGDEEEEENAGRPFQLVFVDFGMAVHVPPAVSENLRKLLVAVTQRDAGQLTDAFLDLGFFLPGADLDRVTEAEEVILDRLWGRNLLQLSQPDPEEIAELGREFRDLLYDFPFQVPQDFIYLGRAVGMVSGLVSRLNPQINPWYQIERYGRSLIRRQNLQQLSDLNWQSIAEMVRPYLEMPYRFQRLLEQAEKGKLRVNLRTDRETLRHQQQMERRVGQLGWSIVTAAGILSATLIYLSRRRDDS